MNHLDPLGLQTLDLPCDQYDGINLSIDSLTAELAGTYDYKLTVSIETSQVDYPLFTERTIRVDIGLEQVVSDFLDQFVVQNQSPPIFSVAGATPEYIISLNETEADNTDFYAELGFATIDSQNKFTTTVEPDRNAPFISVTEGINGIYSLQVTTKEAIAGDFIVKVICLEDDPALGQTSSEIEIKITIERSTKEEELLE